ncbi:uncharacterized protein L969DRAFT_95101 [Mixia osmundae IAM 14324]|uniref:asparaginase n=1 Tax=Mixia osmundae (strain CBS 9802 / IAM 14324 / JCM 22182 / KY 12970) TaxID=764103 RepID=G7E764_MIXOS|nr:uncharacterized protein L969DRAFT_95101 [Mixia osmundae IAM 14324]KEI38940.1 hypothetical protein L969DRAFT_95101 [Mixia osmundae IAM 14324]GAA98674.1 hypothetical protein E5Q_05362 [Mixia osmundae IAM 14324]
MREARPTAGLKKPSLKDVARDVRRINSVVAQQQANEQGSLRSPDAFSSTSATTESRVLLLYTGGTIGMCKDDASGGYAPIPGYFFDSLKSQSRFHDPYGDSLLGHSGTAGQYIKWKADTAAHTVQSPVSSAQMIDSPISSLPARLEETQEGTQERRPSVTSGTSTPIPPTTAPLAVHTLDGTIELPTLLMPPTYHGGSGGRRIRYAVYEYEKLIDSAEIESSDWIRIAQDVERNYAAWDGFIVVHGTDTMSYTASALSFLLEHLGKPVIVTGAQIPLSEVRNDGVENLLGALLLSGHYNIPEVLLYFDHTAYRGNRTTKSSSFDFAAFSSPNLAPLAEVGINFDVAWDLVTKPAADSKPFNAHTLFSSDVATLRIFPGIKPQIVKAFLAPPVRGIVLETYGAGNAPQSDALLDVFRAAADRGVVIVNVTQCSRGMVSPVYVSGQALAAAGVTSGYDMTTECALAKLGYLLSKPELTPAQVRKLVEVPLRGELTVPPASVSHTIPEDPQERMRELVAQVLGVARQQIAAPDPQFEELNISSSLSTGQVDAAERALYPYLLCRAASLHDGSLKAIIARIEASEQQSGIRPQLKRRFTSGPPLLNVPFAPTGQTPLHIAALRGLAGNVALLLKSGASVHIRDLQDHTPLFYAAREGSLACVETMRSVGAHLGEGETSRGEVGLEWLQAKQKPTLLAAWQAAGATDDALVPLSRQL